eukprot:m51a1_g10496 hypothetical protein (167) ;mRNA; r:85620-92962
MESSLCLFDQKCTVLQAAFKDSKIVYNLSTFFIPVEPVPIPLCQEPVLSKQLIDLLFQFPDDDLRKLVQQCSMSHSGAKKKIIPTWLMFGMNNGPPHFQHCMDSFLHDLYDYWCSFVDDCICAASMFEDFLHAIEQFLSKCITMNTHCNAAKSSFGMDYLCTMLQA